MGKVRRRSVACILVMALAVPTVAAAAPKPGRRSPHGVVAVIDTGINPYSAAFEDSSSFARRHPSTYIRGYPKDAQPLRLSLDLPYKEAIEKDADVWATVEKGKLYWIPGTKIVGAISFGSGGTNCPSV